MAKKKIQKINKKSLIELFESKIHLKSSAVIQVGESHQSCINGGYSNDWVSFHNEGQPQELYSFGREDCCFMGLTQHKAKYFLEFNSLFVELTMTEFIRLQKMLFKKINVHLQLVESKKNEKDLQMLEKAFADKTKIETRQTIIEKTPKLEEYEN